MKEVFTPYLHKGSLRTMQAVVNVYCAHKSGTGRVGVDVGVASGGGTSLLKGFWPLHSFFNFDVNTCK